MIAIQLHNVRLQVQEVGPEMKMLIFMDPKTEMQFQVPLDSTGIESLKNALGGSGLVVARPDAIPGNGQGGIFEQGKK